jgi:KIF-binding protein
MNICRECWYELGLAYATMLDIKMTKIENLGINEKPTPHQLQKVNILCDKGIKGFQSFGDSYRDKKKMLIPDTISDEETKPILFANIGRLFYKITTPDRSKTIMNLHNSLFNYALFVKRVEERQSLVGPFHGELGVCRDMVNLLPLKIKKMYNNLMRWILFERQQKFSLNAMKRKCKTVIEKIDSSPLGDEYFIAQILSWIERWISAVGTLRINR